MENKPIMVLNTKHNEYIGIIRQALSQLLEGDRYRITSLVFDEDNFGNVWIKLESKDRTQIEFVLDRGQLTCRVGVKTGLLRYAFIDLDDLLHEAKGIDIEIGSFCDDLIHSIVAISAIIIENDALIQSLWNTKYFRSLQAKIKSRQKEQLQERLRQLRLKSWQQIIMECHDQGLDEYPYKIAKVIYSDDQASRAVILDRDGTFEILYERLVPFTEEDLIYTEAHSSGYWHPVTVGKTIVDTLSRAIEIAQAEMPH
jgi:hypothetical protein